MAPHSSTLAWKTPWTEEPGGLQSMGSLSQTRLSNFTFTFHFHALEREMATHCSGFLNCSPPGSSVHGILFFFFCPWDSPGKNTEVGCYALLQGIFLTQGSKLVVLRSSALAGRFFI